MTSPPDPEERAAPEVGDFLTDVSRQLAASLDFDQTVLTVAGLALPYLDSWCIVDIEREQSTRRIAVIHPNAQRHLHVQRLSAAARAQRDALTALMGADAGQECTVRDIDDALLVSVSGDAQQLIDLRALSIGSMIRVPLISQGQSVGTMTFVGSDAERPYTEADALLAQDIASRCAVALENARLYTESESALDLAMKMNERLLVATVQQQDLAEEARDANLATSRFLAIMSHELRTPLNAIVGYADLIALGIAGAVTEQQHQFIEKIHTSTQHLVGIIDDMLDLAKVQAGHMIVIHEHALAYAVIHDAVTMIENQAADADIILVSPRPGAAAITYAGDEKRVRQILTNLLSNAVKFTDPGGTVTIGVREAATADPEAVVQNDGPWVVIEVTDTGLGIENADRKSIFKPFVQLDAGNTRKRGGAGLGLTISRELARQMGGDLTMKSTVGVGSHFSLWLPSPAAGVTGAV